MARRRLRRHPRGRREGPFLLLLRSPLRRPGPLASGRFSLRTAPINRKINLTFRSLDNLQEWLYRSCRLSGGERSMIEIFAGAFLLAYAAPGCGGHGDASTMLVSTDWLTAHLHDANHVILAVGDKADYE